MSQYDLDTLNLWLYVVLPLMLIFLSMLGVDLFKHVCYYYKLGKLHAKNSRTKQTKEVD